MKPSGDDDKRDNNTEDQHQNHVDMKPSANELDLDLGDITLEDEEECGSCMICGEMMLPEKDILHFIADHVTEPERRALCCLSGHTFCMNCWSNHVSIQVTDNGLGCLPCPAFKCGEILDLQWAPILLKSQDLVNRVLQHRQRHIVDIAGYKTCPIEGCGLIIHIPKEHAKEGKPSSTPGGTGSNLLSDASILPLSGVCGNGHCFCLTCAQFAHSPCGCGDVLKWQQLIRDEMKVADVQDSEQPTNGDDLANALWVAANTKRCPRCSTAIEKDEGCNHMR